MQLYIECLCDNRCDSVSWNLHKMNAAPLQTSALLVKEKVSVLYQKTIFPIQEVFCTYTISTKVIML